MKRSLLLIALMVFGAGLFQLKAQRYLSEVFTSVNVTSDVMYASNITIITGAPGLDSLYADIYMPAGDTMSARPVVIISHTGSFLPVPLNGQATGNRNDSTVVEMCNNFAKRGFVAIAMSYRLGWNPVGTQDVRTGTLINAAYRGIQDARTLVRFLRDNAGSGNTYAIDPGKIVMGGIGTGGYISLGCAFLDSYDEINLAKFIDPNTVQSYVDTSLSGDVEGKWTRPLNIGSYVNESSEVQMAFNLGGAVGDSTWIEAGETPVVSFHCPSDPFAPYMFGPVIVPTTGDFVVNVSGSHDVQRISNSLGVNDIYINAIYTDPYTAEADMRNNGHKGLFGFATTLVPQGSPWDWWDTIVWNVPHPTAGTFNAAGFATNPDMTAAKARTYIDTVMNYLSPRIVCTLGLPGCVTTAVEEPIFGSVTVYPNPSAAELFIASDVVGNNIVSVQITDLSGRSVYQQNDLETMKLRLDRQNLSDGLYFVKVTTNNGVITKKVIFE